MNVEGQQILIILAAQNWGSPRQRYMKDACLGAREYTVLVDACKQSWRQRTALNYPISTNYEICRRHFYQKT